MARHLIHIILSVPYRSGRISSLVNTCVISTWCHGTSAVMVVLIGFIGCSVYLHADISGHNKAHLEYSRSGAVKCCVTKQHFDRKIITTSYNPAKHTDHCCRVFTQRLENLNVVIPIVYQQPTTYILLTALHGATHHLRPFFTHGIGLYKQDMV